MDDGRIQSCSTPQSTIQWSNLVQCSSHTVTDQPCPPQSTANFCSCYRPTSVFGLVYDPLHFRVKCSPLHYASEDDNGLEWTAVICRVESTSDHNYLLSQQELSTILVVLPFVLSAFCLQLPFGFSVFCLFCLLSFLPFVFPA